MIDRLIHHSGSSASKATATGSVARTSTPDPPKSADPQPFGALAEGRRRAHTRRNQPDHRVEAVKATLAAEPVGRGLRDDGRFGLTPWR
jgi:hypothetical protein